MFLFNGDVRVCGYDRAGEALKRMQLIVPRKILQTIICCAAIFSIFHIQPCVASSDTSWNWIWAPDGSKPPETLYFRQDFQLKKIPVSTELYITADDGYAAYLNQANQPFASGNDWTTVHAFRIKDGLKLGRNVLCIECKNVSHSGGLLFKLIMKFSKGTVITIVSSDHTLVNRNPPIAWTKIALPDGEWPHAVVVAPVNGGAWGKLHGALEKDYGQVIRIWNINRDVPAGTNPYSVIPQQGDRMFMSSTIAPPSDLRILKCEGFSLIQSDCDHLSSEETAPGVWNWKQAEAERSLVTGFGLDWDYAEQETFPPPWYKKIHNFTPVQELGDNATIEAFSPWSRSWPEYIKKGYEALGNEFGTQSTSGATSSNRLSALVVGVYGEYGDVGYMTGLRIQNPVQKANWLARFGNLNDTEGFWCADPLAVSNFQTSMLAKYHTLEALNNAWNTAYTSIDQIAYPQDPNEVPSAENVQHYLDFIQWYRHSMGHAMELNLQQAQANCPDTPLIVTAGFPNEDLRGGNDNSLIPKIAASYHAEVRAEQGGLEPFAENAATMFGRIGSACRFYGVPLWAGFSGDTTANRTVSRIYEAVSQGAIGYFDTSENAVKSYNRDIYYKYNRFLTVDKPVVDFAVFYPEEEQELHPDQGYNTFFARECARLRDKTDFDIVDDRMVDDGCLSHYRILALWQGTVCSPKTLMAIKEWVNNGGVLVAYDFGKVTTFSGDISWFHDMYGYVQGLDPATLTDSYYGKDPEAYRLSPSRSENADFFSGEWLGSSSTIPDARWTGSKATVLLPMIPGRQYVLTIHATLPPDAVGLKHTLLLNGVPLGNLNAAGDVRYRFVVPQSAMDQLTGDGPQLYILTIDSQTFTPAPGSSDSSVGNQLGIAITSIGIHEANMRASTEAPQGIVQQHLDLSRLLSSSSSQSWARRYGKGLTVYFPATRVLIRGYIAVLNELVYHLSSLDPDRKDALPIDGLSDGVYATLFPDKILYYNSTANPVSRVIKISKDQFAQWSGIVDTPLQNEWNITLPPHSIRGIYFTDTPQELLYECEGFTDIGKWKVENSPDCSPGVGPSSVWIGGGGTISTHVNVEVPGSYNIFVRCLHGTHLQTVSVAIDNQLVIGPNSVEGDVIDAGSMVLGAGTHSISLTTPDGTAVRADFVLLSNNQNAKGYRFALQSVPLSTQN